MPNFTRALFLALVLPGCVPACEPVDLDLGHCSTHHADVPTVGVDSVLSVGASILVLAQRTDAEGKPTESLVVETTNPAVLEATIAEDGNVHVVARGPGSAEVIVKRAIGTEVGRHSFDVAAPTRFELFSSVEMLAGATVDEARVGVPRALAGSTVTLAVRAFAGDTELRLAGFFIDADLDEPMGISILPGARFAPDATITPTGIGIQKAHLNWLHRWLSFPPELDTEIDVEVVASSTIASLEFPVDESGASAGACMTVVPLARDAANEVVEGIDFEFSQTDGEDFGTGQVLDYEVEPNTPIVVRARAAGRFVDATIHGRVESANASDPSAGCSIAGSPAGLTGSLGPAAAALLLLARRRRSRRG